MLQSLLSLVKWQHATKRLYHRGTVFPPHPGGQPDISCFDRQFPLGSSPDFLYPGGVILCFLGKRNDIAVTNRISLPEGHLYATSYLQHISQLFWNRITEGMIYLAVCNINDDIRIFFHISITAFAALVGFLVESHESGPSHPSGT